MVESEAMVIPIRAEVREVREETRDTKTYKLYIKGKKSEEFRPGQFLMIYLKGFGEIPISLSDLAHDLEDGVLATITVRGVGVVSRYLLSNVREGDVIGVRGPFGRGWPVERAKGKDILIAGGGIGFAPLRPVLRYVWNNREEYGKIFLVYGARSPADMIYRYELESYRSIPNAEIHFTIDRAAEGWKGEVGFVPDVLTKMKLSQQLVSFVCGPEIMMRIASKKLIEAGIDPERIFVSLERRMRCGMGICGTCQFGPYYVCRDGPVFSYSEVYRYMEVEGI
ncbi:MAG: FAD/NAD(P)-binding protein [Fervidicoccaceae archaeon]